MKVTRRNFIRNSALGLTGLLVAFQIPSSHSRSVESGQTHRPNAFIHIKPDNTVELIINRLEMGQGIHTALAMLIAEELDLDFKNITCKSSGVDEVYNDPKFHVVTTQGSTSVHHSWDQFRKIGAGMRAMLLMAAAKKYGAEASKFRTGNGFVILDEKKIPYGDLAVDAMAFPFPENVPLKKSGDFKLIGKSQPAVESLKKVNGSAVYGTDIRLPNMVFASILRPSLPNSKLLEFDKKSALAIDGILEIFIVQENKIAVVARSTYAALSAKKVLKPKWKLENISTEKIFEEMKVSALKKGLLAHETPLAKSRKKEKFKLEASFSFPYLAHTPMEPLNCTVNYDGKSAVFYGGFQRPTEDRKAVAKVLGLNAEAITLEVTLAGGSFGRRDSKDSDWVVEAAEVAKRLRKPVQVLWDRQDDIQGGYYRPMAFHKASVSLSEDGILEWKHHVVGQSILEKSKIEGMLLQGLINSPYTVLGFTLEQTIVGSPVKTLWWRSVGHSHTAFVMETLLDEIAEKLKKDPFDLRKAMLTESSESRSVIEKLKEIHNAQKVRVKSLKRALGFAIHTCSKTTVGYLSEVSIESGNPKVHQVWAVVSCGKVVNPKGAAAQIEGGIAFGLSSMFQEITIEAGRISQTNFDDFPVSTMKDMPIVETHFIESEEHPTGLGEPGVPPLAPSVANAIYQITGERIRKLPWKITDFN